MSDTGARVGCQKGIGVLKGYVHYKIVHIANWQCINPRIRWQVTPSAGVTSRDTRLTFES